MTTEPKQSLGEGLAQKITEKFRTDGELFEKDCISLIDNDEQVKQLVQDKARAEHLVDWAETLLCNVIPMNHCHCPQSEWDDILKKWRDEKHDVFPDGLAKERRLRHAALAAPKGSEGRL